MLPSEWERNILGVDDFRTPGKLSIWYEFIRNNHLRLEGDVVEFGVFRGRSLLTTAMLLKSLGSTKLVYGYDTFGGFPDELMSDPRDGLEQFSPMRASGEISESHYQAHLRLVELRSRINGRRVASHSDLSSSGNFAEEVLPVLEAKIEYLELDNVRLIQGPFSLTLAPGKSEPSVVMCALLDCDLYASYSSALEFVWPRVTSGGLIFLDEYFSLKFPGARLATNAFLRDVGRRPKLLTDRFRGDRFERWGIFKD